MNKKIAVVLSGCGKMDGSEIHEATTLLLALSLAGLSYQCFAPNIPQSKVLNHITGDIMSLEGDNGDRNVLVESARIARGNILDLKEFKARDYAAVVFPGGMGAVSNLCNYDVRGVNCYVNPMVEKVIHEAFDAGIVIGAMCIAPVVVARVLGAKGVEVTIGNDITTAANIEAMGARHVNTPVTEAHVDTRHKVVTTPAYMLAQSIKEVYVGAVNLVKAVEKLCG